MALVVFFFIFVGFSIIPEGVLVKGFTSLSRTSSYFFNTNLGGEVFLPRWFSLNNLETVKAVNYSCYSLPSDMDVYVILSK